MKLTINKFLVIFIFIPFLFITAIYASFSSELMIDGIAHLRAPADIRITNLKVISQTNNAYETYSSEYNKDSTSTYVTLPNLNSKITYEATITNTTPIGYDISNINIISDTNSSIAYKIDGMEKNTLIEGNQKVTFTITMYYEGTVLPSDITDTLVINYEFTEHIYDIEIVNTMEYSVFNNNQTLPIVISNNDIYTASAKVLYKGEIIKDNILIPANTKNYIVNVDISSIYESLELSETNSLDLEIITPMSKTFESAVTFKKEQSMVNIKNIETYINDTLVDNSTIKYNENSIIVNNELTSTNKEITYKITMLNNATIDIYKFRNITNLVNSNSNLTYSTNINLSDGILVKPLREYTFEITYTYNSTKTDNKHRQILFFDFRWNYTFGAVTDHLITLSTPQTNTTSSYGDFSVVKSTDTLMGDLCTFDECYAGGNERLEYDSNKGLVLDSDNSIMTLNIDQSMSVEDEYSVYVTLKADTNQEGLPTLRFPGTILAVSESAKKYLTWFGFYKNYLHIYSYRNGNSVELKNDELIEEGFISFNISSYSNKIINIQITGVRGGKTKVYINGVLKKTFNSGTSPVDYKFATIGDLRSGRGLKFTGTIYDLAMYNKALSAAEVNTNWLYAEETWKITS